MHNLTGIFVQKEEATLVDGVIFFQFSVIYPNKRRVYLSESQDIIEEWITKIQRAIGYLSLTDIYNVKVKMTK